MANKKDEKKPTSTRPYSSDQKEKKVQNKKCLFYENSVGAKPYDHKLSNKITTSKINKIKREEKDIKPCQN